MNDDNLRAAISNAMIIWSTTTWVALDILHKKGIATYADIQESIAVVRDLIPKELYSKEVADTLNLMEQTYQPGQFHSPLDPPDGR